MGAFSRDSEQCRKCNYYKDCDDKRRELCAYIIPDEAVEEITNAIMTQCVTPNSVFINDIQNNIDWQTARMEMAQEWSDQVYWAMRGMYDGKSKM